MPQEYPSLFLSPFYCDFSLTCCAPVMAECFQFLERSIFLLMSSHCFLCMSYHFSTPAQHLLSRNLTLVKCLIVSEMSNYQNSFELSCSELLQDSLSSITQFYCSSYWISSALKYESHQKKSHSPIVHNSIPSTFTMPNTQ